MCFISLQLSILHPSCHRNLYRGRRSHPRHDDDRLRHDCDRHRASAGARIVHTPPEPRLRLLLVVFVSFALSFQFRTRLAAVFAGHVVSFSVFLKEGKVTKDHSSHSLR